MEYTFETNDAEIFTPTTNSMLKEAYSSDNGYNVIWRSVSTPTGTKKCKIVCYTSSGIGNKIRDAETGEYYNELVGSCDEYLFFKVCLATGECTSKNNSSTLFYRSPLQYMSHMHCKLSEHDIVVWESNYRTIVKKIKINKETSNSTYVW